VHIILSTIAPQSARPSGHRLCKRYFCPRQLPFAASLATNLLNHLNELELFITILAPSPFYSSLHHCCRTAILSLVLFSTVGAVQIER
jgi:hypothetical protein